MLNNNTLDNTLRWFSEAKPNPTKNDLIVQMGVHFEEVTEMLENISTSDSPAARKLDTAYSALLALANDMKADPESYYVAEDQRPGILDALCDQIVTATGTGYMLGMDVVGAMNEVNRSNWSKFVDGKAIFNEQGKIAKGPDYTKPDLTRFV